MKELGTRMPSFELPDPRLDSNVSSGEAMGENGLLVAFICNHCPYVKHIYNHFLNLHQWCEQGDIGFVAISSNDISTHPQDAPDKMAELARKKGWAFPYLFDESQEVAEAFGAACTPDFFLYDGDGKLFYRGQFDGSRPNSEEPVTGEDIRDALHRLEKGKAPPRKQQPSMGCNIKWKQAG
jgi:peroxiredoxin